jgi:subtilisin family serine protease
MRVNLGAGLSVEKAIEILSKRPGIVFAEPNYILSVDAVSNDSSYAGGTLWGMYGDRTTPAAQHGSQAGEAWAAGHTGSSKVAIGVIDSGIDYTHPDLYLNIWLNAAEIPQALRNSLVDIDGDKLITFKDLNKLENSRFVSDLNGNGRIDAGDLLKDSRWEDGIDNDFNGYIDDLVGWDFVNNDNDPMDDHHHGSHVAGTIAAVGGNGIGIAGVAWSSQIIALKFLAADGNGTTANAVKAVDYFTRAGTTYSSLDYAATNNSYSGGDHSTALFEAIVRGARTDILFVAAAGNSGTDNDRAPQYPANYDTTAAVGYDAVISVASLARTGELSSFSNYGRTSVDLAAPGSDIYSTAPGTGYHYLSGTSMAAPHVAGAIALYSSLSPASSATIRSNLLLSAQSNALLTGKIGSGGSLDVAAFLEKAPSPPPPPPSSGNLIANGSFEDSGTPGDNVDLGWGIYTNDMPAWTSANGSRFELVTSGQGGITATHGNRWLDMDEHHRNMDIRQSVAGLTSGETLTLTFDANSRSGAASSTIEVYWNGTKIGSSFGQGTKSYSFNVTAGSGDGTNTLRFNEIGTADGYGTALDNVVLVRSVAALTNLNDSFSMLSVHHEAYSSAASDGNEDSFISILNYAGFISAADYLLI